MDLHYRAYTINRVMERSSVNKKTGCREWFSTRNASGYGLLSFTVRRHARRIMTSAHRVLYMCVNNIELQRGEYVLHKCANPSCVNIDHLFVGQALENVIATGRNAKKLRPHSRQRIHNDSTIRAIARANGTLREVSEKFNVSKGYVSKIRNGKAKRLVLSPGYDPDVFPLANKYTTCIIPFHENTVLYMDSVSAGLYPLPVF